MSALAAVELRQVARRFGAKWALRGVSLGVARGEIVGVVGHNGSGKSTLLRVVATILRPTRGAGAVLGHDLVRDAEAVRERIALLGHAPGLYEDLTARENLEFAARMHALSDPRRAADAALEQVGLWEARDERARALSSGMQRRVSIARLLLRAPDVLLLDEPFNSLDADGVALIHALIRDARERGGAAIVVAHDMARAGALIDRVEELASGALVAPRERDEQTDAAAVVGIGDARRAAGGRG